MRRQCQVTFLDLDGVPHSVTVPADSLFEACVLALRALKRAGFVELPPGPASRLQVQVLEPSVTHEVTVGHLQRWLEGSSAVPNEQARRKRLKALLNG